jgi:pyrrolysyl-tRNA synthetase-like protein
MSRTQKINTKGRKYYEGYNASGGQEALFEKTAPWTPTKTFYYFIMKENEKKKEPPKRYYRKRVELYKLIDKIKLWPSRQGILHGIKNIEEMGEQVRITTHCDKTFIVNNSRNSRAARWLRNKWFGKVCPICKIPDWKLEKYSVTRFRRHYGSMLLDKNQANK